ncbi:DUF1648 domain-containing protein [uncultured Psychroserpens sp.]|uniref:DUF1648 domain-containing protein n=1 Tax=uncultured Psychroserpens sp. TaxID=255436 RepID=UPI002629EA7D|nr:DUF1648 domain-containing protein [uncultured Psychroserpens sp.]
MSNNRPRIKVPYEPLDIVVDLTSVTLLLLMIVYTIMSYSELPDIIPSHLNVKGEVDGHSEKSFLWVLPGLSLIMFLGLSYLNKFPHIHNYMVNITEENALKNYRFSTRILRFTNLFVVLVFACIAYFTIQTAKGHATSIGSWFVPTIIGLSIILPILVLIYSRKINKS